MKELAKVANAREIDTEKVEPVFWCVKAGLLVYTSTGLIPRRCQVTTGCM